VNAPVEAPPAVGAAPIAAPPPPLRRNRDFALLWAGMAVSVLGSRISATAYPLLVLALTHSPADAGIVGFLATLPYLLVQLPAGAFIDRWNRKRTMIACDIGRGLALASLVIAFWLGSLTLPQIMVVSFIEGSLFVFYNLAEAAAVQAVVPRSQLPTALSRNEARNRAAATAYRPAGGQGGGVDAERHRRHGALQRRVERHRAARRLAAGRSSAVASPRTRRRRPRRSAAGW